MEEVAVGAGTTESFRTVLSNDETARTGAALDRTRRVLADRTIWHVNSTANGGGVAELLHGVLPYTRGAGIDARWLVIGASDGFLEITKRIHHHLHDQTGDGGPLGERQRTIYEDDLDEDRAELCARVAPGDVVVLHDPQTAGLAPTLRRHGARVVWRCHVGVDTAGPHARDAWAFLSDDVCAAELWIFSRAAHVWETLDPGRVVVMPPCIDVLAAKNRALSSATSRSVLAASGIATDANGSTDAIADGDPVAATVRHPAAVEGAPMPIDTRFVLQVSRWDPLKDHEGVLRGFGEVIRADDTDAHLVLAGPDTDGIADDPEGAITFERVRALWSEQPRAVRDRVHLVSLPMDDAEENAVVVNALQREAQVVVQKSLAEGFGLTVAEAMWKERPVVASRVGGIQDQIVDGESGLLLDDPTDTDAFARTLAQLLEQPEVGERLGSAARRRVSEHFLPLHHFEREADLLERLLA
jgi:trehalose synthase